jgi:hypothetical protein
VRGSEELTSLGEPEEASEQHSRREAVAVVGIWLNVSLGGPGCGLASDGA